MSKENESEEEKEARIERMQIEEVFGLTGGELEREPWEPFEPDSDELVYTRAHFRYWYEGAPDYSDQARDYSNTYITVILCLLYGEAPKALYEKGARWELVSGFSSSGETSCPWTECESCDGKDERPCELCEAQEGEGHGCIYIGDGYSEVVYRQVETCHCGADMTYHADYGHSCLECKPYLFLVEAVEQGQTILYEGSDPILAEAAYKEATDNPLFAKADIYLSLDGNAVRHNWR